MLRKESSSVSFSIPKSSFGGHKLTQLLVNRLGAQIGSASIDYLIEEVYKLLSVGCWTRFTVDAHLQCVIFDVRQVFVDLLSDVGLRRHAETIHTRRGDEDRRQIPSILECTYGDSEGVWTSSIDGSLKTQRVGLKSLGVMSCDISICVCNASRYHRIACVCFCKPILQPCYKIQSIHSERNASLLQMF